MTPARDTPALSSTRVEDIVAAALGLAVVFAIYLDGRAHVLGLPDSFFTPWHALLYGGLLLTMLWLAIMCRRAGMRAEADRWFIVPAGYVQAVWGAALFALGGMADMGWHMVFGVEFGIDALLSPTHLLMFMGGALLLSGPARAYQFRAGPRAVFDFVGPTVAVLGITAVAAFALSYLSAFITEAPSFGIGHFPEGTPEHMTAEGLASAGLASYLMTSLVMVVPAVVLIRREIAGPGSIAVLVGGLGVLAAVIVDLQNPAVTAAIIIAGLVLDVLLMVLRRRHVGRRGQELIVSAALPLFVWTAQLLAMNGAGAVSWSLEMVSGVVLLSAVVSFAAILILRPATTIPAT